MRRPRRARQSPDPRGHRSAEGKAVVDYQMLDASERVKRYGKLNANVRLHREELEKFGPLKGTVVLYAADFPLVLEPDRHRRVFG